MNRVMSALSRLDWWLVIPSIYLVALGFVIQHAILFKTNGVSLDYNLNSHTLAIFMSLAVALLATYFRPKKWLRVFWVTYVLGILGLVVLLIVSTDEAARWVSIGGLQFQPTEIVKLATVGVLAGTVAKMSDFGSLKTIAISLCLVVVPAVLIAAQPDFGSSVTFAVIWALVMLASTVRLAGLGAIALLIAVAFLIALPLLEPYQQDRITSFLNPGTDARGSNYNSIQASIAIGSGGLLGRGLDSGSQSQLNFLPAQHTDFAFAVTAEKLGLIGALTVVISLTIIMLRMTYLAWITRNMYWRLLLIGLVGMFLGHSLINIGMNIGLLPVTGLPLPFISYGGTFLFVSLTGVLLAVIISTYVRDDIDNNNKTLQ